MFFFLSGLPTRRGQAAASSAINHAVGTNAGGAALSGPQVAVCSKQVSKRRKEKNLARRIQSKCALKLTDAAAAAAAAADNFG